MIAAADGWSDVIVIGAGPEGLAVARELDPRHGIRALVVDRAAAPAMSWRRRYDNFRLNTSVFLSHLPGQRIPLSVGRWPSKEDMVCYFDSYVQRQNISLRLGCEVDRIDRADRGWQLETTLGGLRARAVVLATGNYRTATVPLGRESPPLQALSCIRMSHIGDGLFAIGYGIPPRGPLRAIRLAANPLARRIGRYLADNPNGVQLRNPLRRHV